MTKYRSEFGRSPFEQTLFLMQAIDTRGLPIGLEDTVYALIRDDKDGVIDPLSLKRILDLTNDQLCKIKAIMPLIEDREIQLSLDDILTFDEDKYAKALKLTSILDSIKHMRIPRYELWKDGCGILSDNQKMYFSRRILSAMQRHAANEECRHGWTPYTTAELYDLARSQENRSPRPKI